MISAFVFINIALNSMLILYAQTNFLNEGIGAAIATLIFELYIMAADLILVTSEMFKRFSYVLPAKLILAGMVMGGSLKLAENGYQLVHDKYEWSIGGKTC